MADHEELVAEMPILEQMGTQERQKLAKKRRIQQLKKWSQREKEWIAKEKQLNKRIANIINEENNGLNLKQYTTYDSAQRTKKRLTLSSATSANNNGKTLSTTNGKQSCAASTNEHINETSFEYLNINNNNNVESIYAASKHAKSLAPNGRVHFNVGIMLLEAAARNDYDEVKRLLSLGVSPDSVNHDGLTALHQCCIDASEPIMNLLLEFGANVDARDTERWTPLHAACTCGHLNLVRILVEHGADLLAVNGDGNMPFDICEDETTLDYIESQMFKRGITQEMIDLTRASAEMQMLSDLEQQVAEGRDLNRGDENGVTQLHTAAANNYLSVVKFMLKHGVNVNVCDKDLWRPLHGVACWGNEQHVKLVELLVEAGADLNAKTINDETIFDLCDNVDLLEKLNQLKDELESRQASGTDRLKRTQSRTNSRVHSVRRTSVRDKNQISRREAREEALLRVESETSILDSSGSSGASSSTVPGADRPHVSPENCAAAVAKVTSAPREGPDIREGHATSSGTVIVGNNSYAVANGHNVAQQLKNSTVELSAKVNDIASSKQKSTEQKTSATRSHEGQSEPSAQAQIQVDRGGSASEAKNQLPPNELDSQNSQEQQQRVTGSRLLLSTELIHSTKIGATTSNRGDETLAIPNYLDERDSSAFSRQDQNMEDSDLSKQRQISSTTTIQVQFAPINYTLSNLKKHRSDLRMRNGTIGGNSISSLSINGRNAPSQASINIQLDNHNSGQLAAVAAVANSAPPMRPVVQLNPEPMSSSGSSSPGTVPNTTTGDDQLRPESPSVTFRKFHGEPSELIGSRVRRKTRRKCCIVV